VTGTINQVPLPLDIPEKLYFKIGEVAKITGLKPYVLRYWETEFSPIRPTKSKTNQRVYQRKDIEVILLIKKLLYDEKFTIEGARARLKELKASARESDIEQDESSSRGNRPTEALARLHGIRERLVAIHNLLERNIGA
jgi:DNA-binding transcriptional MerR regulator